MAVPARVRRGANSSDYYYWDGVNPMTPLENGWGGILSDDFGVGLVTLSVNEFEVMQAELLGRELAFFDRLDARVNGV
jgi:hypothetical protein